MRSEAWGDSGFQGVSGRVIEDILVPSVVTLGKDRGQFFFAFRERRRGREKHRCEKEMLTNCLLHVRGQWIELQPGYVP